jgi:hypothetical protein
MRAELTIPGPLLFKGDYQAQMAGWKGRHASLVLMVGKKVRQGGVVLQGRYRT